MTTPTTPERAMELADLIDAGEASAESASAMRSLAQQVEELAESANTCGSGAGCLHKDAVIESLTEERDHWKANHDAQVQRARVLIDREDLPLERVQAYEQIGILTAERDMYLAACSKGRPVEHEYSSYIAFARALEVYCTTLENERDALKADAGRYQWWIDVMMSPKGEDMTVAAFGHLPDDPPITRQQFGECIDAAMKAAS